MYTYTYIKKISKCLCDDDQKENENKKTMSVIFDIPKFMYKIKRTNVKSIE